MWLPVFLVGAPEEPGEKSVTEEESDAWDEREAGHGERDEEREADSERGEEGLSEARRQLERADFGMLAKPERASGAQDEPGEVFVQGEADRDEGGEERLERKEREKKEESNG